MNEDFLHHLWLYKLYKPALYFTTNGEDLEIINPGQHNTDAGPDFFNAKIKIGNTLWAGNIEIHRKSSDWFKHGHQNNSAFNNVILHVVIKHDAEATTAIGTKVPTWIMKIPKQHKYTYKQLKDSKLKIPCIKEIKKLEPIIINSWIERMMIEKLENKVNFIKHLLKTYNNDWDEVLYILIVRNFGFGVNANPFEQLARKTPWRVIVRNRDDKLKLEAIFLGQAGFLNEITSKDSYTQELHNRYIYLKQKYNLSPMPSFLWKFMRLRPYNFPTIRLVQLAALFEKRIFSLDQILKTKHPNDLSNMLLTDLKSYWLTHYQPGIKSAYQTKKLGKQSRNLIIINTLIPLIYSYGLLRDNEKLKLKAIKWLETLPYENNAIIKLWKNNGINSKSAFESQALIHLTNNYCNTKRCLHCRIGHLIIASKHIEQQYL